MIALDRVLALVGLRWKLSQRVGSKNQAALFLIIRTVGQSVVILALVLFGVTDGSRTVIDDETQALAASRIAGAFRTLQIAFLATWSFQILGALMVAAVDQFLDLTRLLHLPIRSGEIFLATQLSGLVSLGGLTLIVYPVGVAIGAEVGVFAILGVAGIAILSTVAARGFGSAIASMIQFFIGRRRLRDITIVLSAAFALLPMLLRRRVSSEITTGSDSWLSTMTEWYLPSTPFARWVGSVLGIGEVHAYDVVVCFVAVILGLWIAHQAFARMIRYVDDRQSGAQVKAVDERSWLLPSPVAAVARLTRRLWWREPRLRAIVIQNTLIFGVMGIFGATGELRDGSVPPLWLPFILLFAHGTFMTTQLSIDGPGIGMGLVTCVPRFQFLMGRAIGILGVLIPSAMVILAIPFLMSVMGQSTVPLIDFLPIAVCVVIMEATGVGLGMLVSVIMPSPALGSARRREVTAQDGCGRSLVYLIFSLPAAICSIPAMLLAIFPWILARFQPFGWEMSMSWMFITMPAALLFTAALGFFLIRLASIRMESKEEALISIVSATS